MNNSSTARKIRTLLIVIVLVSLPLLIFVRFFTGTTLVIDLSGADSVNAAAVLINGQPVRSRNEAKKSFKITGQKGSKSIKIRVAGYEDYETRVSTLLRTTKTIKPELKPVTADQLASRLDIGRDISGYTKSGAKYFQNNTWLAYRLNPKSGGNPDIVIARHDNNSGEWIIMNAGDEGEVFFDENAPMPDELYNEFFGVNT